MMIFGIIPMTNIAKELGYGARVARMPWEGGSTDAAAFARGGTINGQREKGCAAS